MERSEGNCRNIHPGRRGITIPIDFDLNGAYGGCYGRAWCHASDPTGLRKTDSTRTDRLDPDRSARHSHAAGHPNIPGSTIILPTETSCGGQASRRLHRRKRLAMNRTFRPGSQRQQPRPEYPLSTPYVPLSTPYVLLSTLHVPPTPPPPTPATRQRRTSRASCRRDSDNRSASGLRCGSRQGSVAPPRHAPCLR